MNKLLLLLLFFLLVFPVASASAFSGTLLGINSDNIEKTYDPINHSLEFKDKNNKFIGSTNLITPIKNHVSPGLNVTVATERNYNLVEGLPFKSYIKESELENLRGRAFNKRVHYKLVEYSYKQVLSTRCDYLEVPMKNGTIYICNEVPYYKNVTVRKQKVVPKYVPVGEYFEIDIVLSEVKLGEHGDWVYKKYDLRVPEYAEWTSDLNTSLVSYFKLDEQDTTGSGTIFDSVGGLNMTNSGADNSTGKILTGYDFVPGNSDYISRDEIDLGQNLSVFAWIYPDSVDAEIINNGRKDGGTYGSLRFRVGGGDLVVSTRLTSGDTTGNYQTDDVAVSTGQWYFVGFTRADGEKPKIYVNATEFSGTSADTWAGDIVYAGGQSFYLGAINSGGNLGGFWDGKQDEVMLYNRVLNTTEITLLWNNGDGLPFGPPFVPPTQNIIIALNSPAQNANRTSQSVTLNCTVYDGDSDIVNVSLLLDGVVDQTNTSGLNGSAYIFTDTFNTGSHLWGCQGCNNMSECVDSTNRTFFVDLNISGTVKAGAVPLGNASVFILNQSDNSLIGNVTSGAGGAWTMGPMKPGTYIITGYDPTNSTLEADAKNHVVIP